MATVPLHSVKRPASACLTHASVFPFSCPPAALVKEVLSNVQRLTFYGFLVALSKHHGINQALGKLEPVPPAQGVADVLCPSPSPWGFLCRPVACQALPGHEAAWPSWRPPPQLCGSGLPVDYISKSPASHL